MMTLSQTTATLWRGRGGGQQPDRGRPCRLKARLRPMRGLKQDRSVSVIIAGHAFIENVRCGHYELAVQEPANRRVAVVV
jgi:hypothetical protein